MSVALLDSGAVSRLAKRSTASIVSIRALASHGLWPAVVPTVVLVECLTDDPRRDARTNALLKQCGVLHEIPERIARRAAALRTRARRGSAVDALLVALAEPGGAVITRDVLDLDALAAYAVDVSVVVL